jgi:adenylate kinase
VIIILGTPGAGKTTQAQLLAQYLDCPWFSMGQLIRDKVTGQDRKDMLDGKIISDQVTLGIIDKTIAELDIKDKECVFEGNPRSIPQAKWWLKQVHAGRFSITAVIHLVADTVVAEKRLVNRGRLDDHNDNVVETRFEQYYKSITPTLNFLKRNGVAVLEVDANGSIEQEAQLVHQALGI